MRRRRITIRGVDQDAWELLIEIRENSRTQTGALVSEALRFWYEHLADDEEEL